MPLGSERMDVVYCPSRTFPTVAPEFEGLPMHKGSMFTRDQDSVTARASDVRAVAGS